MIVDERDARAGRDREGRDAGRLGQRLHEVGSDEVREGGAGGDVLCDELLDVHK
jgi:hypothetical protein